MNGQGFILWTTAPCGIFKAMKATREEYDESLRNGTLRVSTDVWVGGDLQYEEVVPHFIAFGTIEDNYDRGLGRRREAAAAA